MLLRILIPTMLALALSGCVTIPAPLQGDFALAPLPAEVSPADRGQAFRWGGTLIETRPGEASTCVELLARELDSQFRPRASDAAFGRFRACRPGFLDPEVFTAGRDVTVVGSLDGFEDGHVGEFVYRFPRLQARAIYLWPERVEYHDPYYYGPAWRYYSWPYWPYGGPYWIGRYRIHGVHGSALTPEAPRSAAPGSSAVRSK